MNKELEMKKYYELMGRDEKSSTASIKNSFREILKEYTGDTWNEHLAEIVEAYVVLTNDEQRKLYDSLSEEEFALKYKAKQKKEIGELCSDIRDHERRYIASIDNQIFTALRHLITSLLIFLVGVGITYSSYVSAKPGGRYVICVGLIVVGFIRSINWFSEWRESIKAKKEHRNYPDRIWDTFIL